jgi:hypothetical protein
MIKGDLEIWRSPDPVRQTSSLCSRADNGLHGCGSTQVVDRPFRAVGSFHWPVIERFILSISVTFGVRGWCEIPVNSSGGDCPGRGARLVEFARRYQISVARKLTRNHAPTKPRKGLASES